MGGLAGVRRGRTAGDLTGGGGRSVEAVRRGGDPRRSGLSRAFGQGYYGPPPPGGGYSGGVIPRFQTGGQMQSITSGPPQAPSPPSPSNFRYGFEHSGNYPWMPQSWRDRMAGLRTSVSARSLPQKLQQFQTRSGPNVTDILKEQPAWWPESARGWRAWQIPRPGIEGHSVGVAPTGTRNLSGSGGRGGYSGGVVPRFQEGGEVTWQNATPEQWAALNRPAWAPEGGAWSRQARRDQHLAARGLPPSLYTGANKRYLAPRFRRGFSGPPVSIPPGGG